MKYPAFGFAAVVFCLLVGPGVMGDLALAQQPALHPLSQLLKADGTLDLSTGQAIALDPSGYEMSLDEQGRPRFTPARQINPFAPQAIEKWSPEYGFCGADNIVTALAVYQGSLYIGGYFSAIGPIFANRIARWDGSSWSPLGSGVDGNVHAILVTSTGVIIGGDFIYAGDVFCQRIARWDGARWNPLGEGFNGKVRALATIDGTLYAGGEFTSSGSTSLLRIAKWDGNQWNAVGAGCNAPVLTFAVNGSDLYVGGEFTFVGTTPANRIARWTGVSWFTLASGANNIVRALAYYNGYLYAGGDFSTAGTATVNYIARWNGAAWSALGSGADQRITAIAIDPVGQTVYVGGHFYAIGGGAASRLAKWNINSSSWSAVGDGVNSFVYALAFSEGNLHVGGDFSMAGNITANHIAGWNGSQFNALHTGKGFNGNVYAILVDGMTAYVGGSFTQGGGIKANNIIKYDGTTWSTLQSGISGPVYALVKQGSDIYAGGRFNSASGIAASNIAKWNGASWSPLGSGLTNGSPGTGTVYALASNNIDSLVAGGEFNTAGGTTAYRVAYWNGTTWRPLGLGMDNTVYALAYESFMFYAGGKFKYTQGGGYYLYYAALWDDLTGVWRSMGSTGVDSTVYVMRPGAAGVLYVGGNFTQAGGLPARRLARWEGSLWDGISTGANDKIRAIDVVGDKLYIGGDFSEAGGIAANRFAILNLNTNQWTAPGNGLDSSVYALGNGDLYLGGAFTAAGSKPSFHFAQWLENSYVFLQAKLFLQGAYDSGSNRMTTLLNSGKYIPLTSPYADHRVVDAIPANITDWVMVELRDASYTAVARKSVFLHRDGFLVDDDGVSRQVIMEGVPDGSYYLTIHHRNHMTAMSSAMISYNGGPAGLYDFTISDNQYYSAYSGGRSCVELESGTWGVWAGDINQDGFITTRDYVVWYGANYASESGYCVSDIDLNGSVATSDYSLWYVNARIDPRRQMP